MNAFNDTVLILSDIEGSSGCWDYRGSQFRTPEWARACAEMSRDVHAVVTALFDAGAAAIYVKDFHRTGYNLQPELIDRRAHVIHGYRRGPVPGIGGTHGAGSLLMIGMHAASGSGGFLAHTLTSRIARLEVNGRLMAEAELFSASMAPYLVRPIFISGCPVTCRQAEERIPGIGTWAIEKNQGPGSFDVSAWRSGLARAAAKSLCDNRTAIHRPEGPFRVLATMRDGVSEAARLSKRWGLGNSGDTIEINSPDMASLYLSLIRLCYLTPVIEKMLPAALTLFNVMGYAGLRWVRKIQRTSGAV